jgi:lysozyme
MRTSEDGLDEIRKSEALRLHAYPDPASPLAKATPRKRWGFVSANVLMGDLPEGIHTLSGEPWTLGYGNTFFNGRKVQPGDECTAAEAEANLRVSVQDYERGVLEAVRAPLTQPMFDALVSLCYNIGIGAFQRSTLVRKLNAGDYIGATEQFDQWVWAGGEPILAKRRDREQEWFRSGIRAALAEHPVALEAFNRFTYEADA